MFRRAEVIDASALRRLQQQDNRADHIIEMHQIDAVRAILQPGFPRQKAAGMTTRPHQPRQPQNIDLRAGQIVQPAFQRGQGLARHRLRLQRAVFLHYAAAAAVDRGRAGEDNARHLLRQRAVHHVLHRLHITFTAFRRAAGGQGHHQRVDRQQQGEILGVALDFRRQPQLHRVDAAAARRLHAVQRGFAAGNLPAARR